MKQADKTNRISLAELNQMAEKMYGSLVKADVDVAQRTVVLDAELHADIESYMLDHGSRQSDLWGINIYPENYGKDNFIEFDSMINIRPSQNNRSRFVEDPAIRERISDIIMEVISE